MKPTAVRQVGPLAPTVPATTTVTASQSAVWCVTVMIVATQDIESLTGRDLDTLDRPGRTSEHSRQSQHTSHNSRKVPCFRVGQTRRRT